MIKAVATLVEVVNLTSQYSAARLTGSLVFIYFSAYVLSTSLLQPMKGDALPTASRFESLISTTEPEFKILRADVIFGQPAVTSIGILCLQDAVGY